jgi:hypothetical protein
MVMPPGGPCGAFLSPAMGRFDSPPPSQTLDASALFFADGELAVDDAPLQICIMVALSL